MTSCYHVAKTREVVGRLEGWKKDLEEAISNPPSEQAAERAAQELPIVERLLQSYIEFRDELDAIEASRPPRPVSLEDIKHCKTQPEVLYVVAEHYHGEVNLHEVAQLIVKARMTRGAQHSAYITMSRYVANHDDWVSIGRGRAWLLKFGPAPEE